MFLVAFYCIFFQQFFIFSFDVMQAVLDACDAAISAMKPGVSWFDMHIYD